MMMNRLNCLLVIGALIGLTGCVTTEEQIDTYQVERGSLKLQTKLFSEKYGIDTIAYHRAISPGDDYTIIYPKDIVSPEFDLQLALQQMYDGSPYIPVLDNNVLRVYPMTTKHTPLAGNHNTQLTVNTSKTRKVDAAPVKSSNLEGTELSRSARNTKVGNQKPTDFEKSNAEVSQHDVSNSKIEYKADTKIAKKGKAQDEAPYSESEKVSSSKPPMKVYTVYSGQSYRDTLANWLKEYEIDNVLFATGPLLGDRLKRPEMQNLQYKASNETDIFNLLNQQLTKEDPSFSFKVRISEYKDSKIAIVHQFSSANVSIFELEQGSLKSNAFRMAKKFDYEILDDDSEFRSWNIDNDPQVQSSTLTVVPDNVRLAYGVLFNKYNAKALLLDSSNTAFFVPRSQYKVNTNAK
ncbi:hypothetical protein A1QO_05460 [Vibrio genomosp. F10 str. ZF-129]|uniref:Uncharacterized protein n=1 Tax=Vibrio genomosp. F10 str. ZF-129 TaxID=1187848 RepID=A0A1E5BH13_9VIBR|nr:hypothetical protein [Vibrio genomosp. F10]OEE35716.1 hypothetical protein A1QO_05460 [Vibrio genomosp. F10 str. ZF-129]